MASEFKDLGLSGAALAQFRVLQHRFVAGLADRLAALESAATPTERQALLHRLAGAAGIYGFEQMSAFAAEAEHLANGPVGTELEQVLARLYAQIRLAQEQLSNNRVHNDGNEYTIL